jgi:hypothetical protein
MYKDTINTVTTFSTLVTNSGIIVILLFLIFALTLGIIAIQKRSFKGILLALSVPIFATMGTFHLF